MDLINWWLSWPNWIQDLSVIFVLLVFLSHGARWYRGWPATERSRGA
jgi:hypothetical protein